MNIGDRVKYSHYALQSKRDYWQGCSREPQKSNAKHEYESACAVKGTITAIKPNSIEVTEDNGTVHQCLSYIWERE